MVPGPPLSPDPAPIPIRRRLFGVALGGLAWAAFQGLSAVPELAEALAGTGPVPALRRLLSLGTGIVPFALAELFVAGVLLRQGLGALRGMEAIRAARLTPLRALGAGGLRLAQDAGILLFLFYLLWGFQYARPGLAEQLGFEVAGEATAEELAPLAREAVARTNRLYETIHGGPDGGEATAAVPISEVTRALEASWERVEEGLGLPPRVSLAHGDPKRFLLATPMLKRFGVAGMHFPFTGEALVLADLPGALLGTDVAHEMAHQRGFAREDDANVLGFLVASRAEDPHVRYAAYNFLHRQLVSAYQRVAPDEAVALSRTLHPGVNRDQRHLYDYWEPSRGVAGATAARVNDAMLRSHGIPEGVASYRGSVWVLIALAREHGADVLFPEVGEGERAEGP